MHPTHPETDRIGDEEGRQRHFEEDVRNLIISGKLRKEILGADPTQIRRNKERERERWIKSFRETSSSFPFPSSS